MSRCLTVICVNPAMCSVMVCGCERPSLLFEEFAVMTITRSMCRCILVLWFSINCTKEEDNDKHEIQ